MSMETQLYNLLLDFIYGNIRFRLELADEFVMRGNREGWPQECWAYLPRIMIMRDLLRLALDVLGDLPVLGLGGSVASVWNSREDARRGGGRGGGMGDGGSDGLSGGGLGGLGLSGGGLGGDVDSVG